MTKKTKKEIVYDYVLERIISRKIHSNDHLNISQIAQECGVSEIPVREALRQLEGDGYVAFSSNKGAFATGINRNEIAQIVQVKGVLEAFAARLAIDNLSNMDIENLTDLNNQMKEAMVRNDRKTFSEKNLVFHRYICESCENEELIKHLRSIWKRWAITQQVFFGSDNVQKLKESCEEHDTIIEMIRTRNYTGIEHVVRQHKFRSVSYWLLNPGN